MLWKSAAAVLLTGRGWPPSSEGEQGFRQRAAPPARFPLPRPPEFSPIRISEASLPIAKRRSLVGQARWSAAGKGVTVFANKAIALDAISRIMAAKRFGDVRPADHHRRTCSTAMRQAILAVTDGTTSFPPAEPRRTTSRRSMKTRSNTGVNGGRRPARDKRPCADGPDQSPNSGPHGFHA